MAPPSAARFAALTTVLLLLLAPLGFLAPAAGAPAPAPQGSLDWVADWLAFHDRNGNKVDDAAEGAASGLVGAGKPDAAVGVLVSFDHAPDDADRAALAAAGADRQRMYTFTDIPTVNTVVPAARVAELGAMPGVAAVEWDAPLVPALDISSPATQALRFDGTGPNAVYNGRTAQDLGYTGAGMVVAVADTGVNELHEAFAGKFVASADATAILPPTCSPTMDEALHGTHVASTAVGNPAGKPHKGTAIDARLVELKVGSAVSLGGTSRALQFAIDWNRAIVAGTPLCGASVNDFIDVWTLSFGSTGRGGPNAGSAEALVTTATTEGMVVTIAAGNCGPSPSATCSFGDKENGISSPANAAGSISVANNDDRNTVNRNDDGLDSSSSRGPNSASTSNANPGAAGGATGAADLLDRHRKPDVSAPGSDIVAANALTVDGYVSLSGTSMATPHVAGLAALILQAGEEAKAQTGGVNRMRPTGPGYTAAGAHIPGQHPVRDALIHSAEYMTAGVPADMLAKWEGPGAAGLAWNNGHGYGHVDVFSAICWAWENVLVPAGATAPPAVTDRCLTVPPLSVNAGGPYAGFAGEPVAVGAAAAGGVPPYAYAWDLDADGAFDDASGAAATVVFPAAGTFTVAVRATDGAAATATASALVTVRQLAAPQLAFSYGFDSDACLDRQGWWDAVGASVGLNPLVPGTPWHLQPLAASSAPCAWYNGVEGGQRYLPQTARNLWGPCFTVPPGATGGRVEFDLAGESEATFDFLYLRLNRGCLVEAAPSVAQGTSSLTVIGRWDGPVGDIAASPPLFAPQSASFDGLVDGGGTFQIGFRFESDILFEEEGYWIDNVRVYVRDTAPVLADPGAQSVAEGAPLAFALSATDADGDPLTYSAEGLPAGATLNAATGAFAWTPGHGAIGSHTVTFAASDGLFADEVDVTITVANLPPVAAGSADRDEADRVNPVQFTDASVDPNGGRVVSWLWEFGDGATSTAQNPSHRYSTLGTKTVTLTVTDEHGASTTAVVDQVKVKNLKPKAKADAPAEANRVDPAAFGDQSADDDGSIVSWQWSFGDGATSTAQNPSHQYTALGDYTVSLTVTDNDGDSSTTTRSVRVVNLLPSVDFRYSPGHPIAFLPVAFDGTAADRDGSVVSYAWTFGDGGSASGEDAAHVYLNGGTYTVRLTVTDNDGGVSVGGKVLFVCEPGADLSSALSLDGIRLEYEACVAVGLPQ